MKAALLKRFFRAIRSGSESELDSLCRSVVEDEKERGHDRVAADLESILLTNKKDSGPVKRGAFTKLPTNGKSLEPLFSEIDREQLRHHMVLPQAVEERFKRIEKEFAARQRLASFGLEPRKRVLLHGPPGCGKSLGAERLAWNTGLPLLKVRFDTLLSSYFGETLTNLRKVFDAATERPCALFLDECDTLARSRLNRNDIGEASRITNTLLEMLEDFSGKGLIIAASNLDSELDSALLRRFDEVLRIPLPAAEQIEGILRTTLSSIETDKRLPWKAIAHEMDGMSCSEVAQIGQNAAKHTILEGRKKVTAQDVRFALDEIHERHHREP